MGIKRYILLTVVYMLAVGLYVYSMDESLYTLSVYKFSQELPVSIWIILPTLFLFVISVAHMSYYSLKDFWKQRAMHRDFEYFKMSLSKKVLGEDSELKYKTELFQFVGASMKMLNYDAEKEILIDDEKVEQNRKMIKELKSGKVVDLKKYKLSEDNQLLEQNDMNRLLEDNQCAADILKECHESSSELCQKAYLEYVRYASYVDIKKLDFKPTKEVFRVLMDRYLKEEGSVAIKISFDEIQELLMQFNANREDYLELAYEIKSKLEPDSLIELFEKLYNSDKHLEVTDSYLYVLYELQMIGKLRDILESTDEDEFIKWKTILFLRDSGRNVDSEIFLRV